MSGLDQSPGGGLKDMPPPRSSGGDNIFSEFFGSSGSENTSRNYGDGTGASIPNSSRGGFQNGFNPRSADDIFGEYFGFSGSENISRNYGDGTGASIPKKPPPVESKLHCSLEELYAGSTRKMKISRTVVDAHRLKCTNTEVLSIEVKSGWKKGTKITFPGKGNQQFDQLPADLVFIIEEKPHDVYKRDSNDLIMNYRVSLAEALGGTTVKFTTLDGRDLSILVNDVISPGYELVVAREGMPISKEPGNRGNLRIKFEVKFPTRLTTEQRATIRLALGG